MKKKDEQRATWAIVGAGSAMLAGRLVDKALTRGSKAFYADKPRLDPTGRDFSWLQAMAWTAATAAVVSMAQMAATRGAAIGWKKRTGKLPPRL